jgi:hypothetical protein
MPPNHAEGTSRFPQTLLSAGFQHPFAASATSCASPETACKPEVTGSIPVRSIGPIEPKAVFSAGAGEARYGVNVPATT